MTETEIEEEAPQNSKNIKVLLEMAIQELCIAQDRMIELQKALFEDIQPRITNALSSLDDILAIKAIEIDENLHQTFLQSFEKVKIFQDEVFQGEASQPTFQEKGKAVMSPASSETEEDEFTLVMPKGSKPMTDHALQTALTIQHYRAYTHWVYSAQSTNNVMIDTSGIYPRIHFLAGTNPEDVLKAVTYGYCGSVTSSPGNREILSLSRVIIESVKKFRRSSRSDMVVLKFLSASPEIYPAPLPGWWFIQLCTPNKANIKIRPRKSVRIPEVNELWICHRRAEGFAILFKKLAHIREINKGFLYNSPQNIFIYADGNCTPRYDAINKISAGISLINSCRVPGSFPTMVHLCGLLNAAKTAGCSICPRKM